MAGKKNSRSGLTHQSGRGIAQGLDLNKLLQGTSLVSNSNSGAGKSQNPGAEADLKNASANSRPTTEGIKFGSPSSTKTATTQTGSEWTNLLKQTASGGVASALGGGLLGIGGLGSLVSGISGLFGGHSKPAPPPLVRFQLPSSQEQTVYISSSGNTVYQGSAVESPSSRPTVSGPIYGSIGAESVQSNSTGTLRYQSSEVAQAVKNAILSSSSLNDVIAEI